MWAEVKGTAIFRAEIDGKISYTYPVGGGDRKAAITAILEECKREGRKFWLHGVNKAELEELEQYFPGTFQVEWVRDVEDYVYETEKLIALSGKKYHGKKNHINQFKAAYPDWSYEPISQNNVEECFQMALRWRELNGCEEDEEKHAEICVTLNYLRLFEELNMRGGALRVNGEIVAFTVGEPVGKDTLVVHIEKAFADIQGAYTMINQQFAEHEGAG